MTGGSFAQPSGFTWFLHFFYIYFVFYTLLLSLGLTMWPNEAVKVLVPDENFLAKSLTHESMLQPGAARMRGSNGMDEETLQHLLDKESSDVLEKMGKVHEN